MKTNIKYTVTSATMLCVLLLPALSLATSEKTVSASGISSVQVGAIQDVEVTTWANNSVKIVCYEGDVNSETLEIKSSAGSIHIKDKEPECEKISITMPANFKLKVSAVSGDVSVRDLKADVRVGSVSGDLRIENILGSMELESVSGEISVVGTNGDLSLKTVSGDIKATKVVAEHLTVKSVSGEVTVQAIKSGSLGMVSHSGEITYAGPTPSKELSAKTFSGEIDISVPDTTGFDIQAKTMSGDIEVEHKIEASELANNRLNGRFKQGGPELNLKSFSGDIYVKISK